MKDLHNLSSLCVLYLYANKNKMEVNSAFFLMKSEFFNLQRQTNAPDTYLLASKLSNRQTLMFLLKELELIIPIIWMENGVFTCHCLSHRGARDHSENE